MRWCRRLNSLMSSWSLAETSGAAACFAGAGGACMRVWVSREEGGRERASEESRGESERPVASRGRERSIERR